MKKTTKKKPAKKKPVAPENEEQLILMKSLFKWYRKVIKDTGIEPAYVAYLCFSVIGSIIFEEEGEAIFDQMVEEIKKIKKSEVP